MLTHSYVVLGMGNVVIVRINTMRDIWMVPEIPWMSKNVVMVQGNVYCSLWILFKGVYGVRSRDC
jgi:hypothetical protein